MTKKENKIIKPNQSIAKVKSIRISTRKLGLLASLIRNMKADKALSQLTFSKKKVAKEGLVKEIRQRQYYEKPSDKRIRKNKEMAAAWKKKQKKLKAQRGF